MSARVLDPVDPGALLALEAECIDGAGRLRAVTAKFYAGFKRNDLSAWCVARGFYCLPTLELVDFIRDQIDCDAALEIGAGNGALGRAVGIPMTDSHQQERPEMAALYRGLGQAAVEYGADVEKLTALEAVEKYRPRVVVAAWVTHRWDRRRPHLKGNMYGVDEARLLDKPFVRRYVFVGSESVHGKEAPKPILSRRHETHRLPFLYSRAFEPTDVVWVWRP